MRSSNTSFPCRRFALRSPTCPPCSFETGAKPHAEGVSCAVGLNVELDTLEEAKRVFAAAIAAGATEETELKCQFWQSEGESGSGSRSDLVYRGLTVLVVARNVSATCVKPEAFDLLESQARSSAAFATPGDSAGPSTTSPRSSARSTPAFSLGRSPLRGLLRPRPRGATEAALGTKRCANVTRTA